MQRRLAGHTSAAALYEELRALGYRASYGTVRNYLRPFRGIGSTATAYTESAESAANYLVDVAPSHLASGGIDLWLKPEIPWAIEAKTKAEDSGCTSKRFLNTLEKARGQLPVDQVRNVRISNVVARHCRKDREFIVRFHTAWTYL